jgi:deazaflavin-dependent oxidoreductase (nitroreductase family)
MQDFNNKIIGEFRANDGVVGGSFTDMPLLLLGTTGAKSGIARTNPLAYLEDGKRLVIIASYAGAPSSPPWFYNLVANPEVTVEVGSDKYQARATVVGEPQRSDLYGKMAAAMPIFSEYAAKTNRVIPVITLTRL